MARAIIVTVLMVIGLALPSAFAHAQPEAAASVWSEARWSPYVCGAGIGVVCWLAFLFSHSGIGASGAFAQTAGMIEAAIRGRDRVWNRKFYSETGPGVDWLWMLVAGVVVGSVASSAMSGSFAWVLIPEMWESAFGPSVLPRIATAFAGGMLLGFGARMAGGCTSGHGISGALQLVVSSWVAAACFFIGGVVTAHLIYP
ncbi:YeeE/YedE thiosulfate transporter family protein [Oceanidesulfovibrio indonesiensis]|nr:YeeE/YedE thiosulfate transporter family protein [Oceanidesulfovibrio indonesiensis]